MQICHLLRLSSLSLWLILLLSFLTEISQLDHCLILIVWRFELLPYLVDSNFALCLVGAKLLSSFKFCRSKKPWEVWRSRSHTVEICAENIVFLASLHRQQGSYRTYMFPSFAWIDSARNNLLTWFLCSCIDSLLMIVVLWRLWCNTSWRLMASVFSTLLCLACKWAINKDQIICLWRLVAN